VNHYPRHVGDYLRDTVELTMLEDGAYTRLLDQYYAREGPLPADAEKVYRMARAVNKLERAAVDAVIARFFTLGPGGWHNKRGDEELQAQSERSAGASKSARLRWSKEHANAMRTHMPTHSEGICEQACETDAEAMLTSNQKPVTIKAESNTKARAQARASPLPPDFAISDQVREWAAENGHGHLEKRLAHFVGYALANGKKYVDWDVAFCNAIRDDWAHLDGRKNGSNHQELRDATTAEIWKNHDRNDDIDGTAERVA